MVSRISDVYVYRDGNLISRINRTLGGAGKSKISIKFEETPKNLTMEIHPIILKRTQKFGRKFIKFPAPPTFKMNLMGFKIQQHSEN